MSWLEYLLPFSFSDVSLESIVGSALETIKLMQLFAVVFFVIAFCTRIAVYHVLYLRRPGRGKEYDLAGKNYVITGCTSGIGKQLAQELFKRNGSIVMLVRNPVIGMEVRREIRETCLRSNGEIFPIYCDLANMASVRSAAVMIMKSFERLDGLVCCAGIGALTRYEKTIDGYEEVIQTNCLSHALLTTILSAGLQLTEAAVINVSSHFAHNTTPFDYDKPFFADEEEDYNGYQAYCRSKLMVNALTMQQTKTLSDDICFLSVYPGMVFTKIGDQFVRNKSQFPALLPYTLPFSRAVFWLIGRTVEQGALTIWPLLVDPDLRPPSGSVIDHKFQVTAGLRLNREKMSDAQLEEMESALNKAISDAIARYVIPPDGVTNPDESDDDEVKMDVNDDTVGKEVGKEDEVVNSPFDKFRRLSQKRKEKFVQKFKGFARRSYRGENSNPAQGQDAKPPKGPHRRFSQRERATDRVQADNGMGLVNDFTPEQSATPEERRAEDTLVAITQFIVGSKESLVATEETEPKKTI